MNTIKIYLDESGRIKDLYKDFPLYQGQFQDKLLNIYVPTSILAPQFDVQHYIGQMTGAQAPSAKELNAFVVANTYPSRQKAQGDIIEFYNTTSLTFYIYTYNGSIWRNTQVDSFGTFTNIAGTSIKVGMIGVQRNGSIYESKSYFLRFLKTLTYQNVEYALYERKLPKEFTAVVGQGQNAPTIVINVVNIDTETNKVLSIITSQTCKLDVMTSTMLDKDEPIEASDLESLEAQVNANAAALLLKQNITDNGLLTTQKNIVGAINEVKGTADTNATDVYNNTQDISDIKAEQITQNENISANTENISANTGNISDLQERVTALEGQVIIEEHYVGQMTGSTLPTDAQLDAFVETQTGSAPAGGEVIIFIQTIADETDKVYKYTYSSFQSDWYHYEIPAAEPASNTSKGIVKGSYSSGTAQKTQVNITNGEIEDIYVVDGSSTKRRLAEYLNTDHATLATTASKAIQNEQDISTASGKITTLEGQVGNILDGTTSVPKATNATNDGLGNNISTTYMTTNAGVTKTQMKDYALPRAFNDVSFFTNTGYSPDVPSGASPIHTLTTTAVGDFEIFSAEKTLGDVTFQLADKNSYTDTIFASASANCLVQFRLTTQIFVNNAWITANVELSDEISMLAGQVKKLVFASSMNALNGVYTLASGNKIKQKLEVVTQTSSSITFSIYSNDTYPSTFYLNTTSQVITLTQGKLGELPVFDIVGAGDTSKITFELPTDVQIDNNVESLFVLHYTGATIDSTQVEFSLGSQAIQLLTPVNTGTNNPATVGTIKSKFCSLANKWVFTGVFSISGAEIKVIADIDHVDATETGNPNLLINGDFRVNQRGLASYTTDSKYCADRWIFRGAGSAAPSISNGITITASTTNTLTGIFQNIEKNDAIKLLGKTVTLSVKVASITLTTKVFRCAVSYSDYSATSVGTVAGKVDVSSSTAGVYSVTIAIPSNIDLDTNTFKVGLFFMEPTANDNATIEWAKLEIGSSATTFSPKTFAEELALCQRYFQKLRINGLVSIATSTATIYTGLPLPVTLRTAPTITNVAQTSIREIGAGTKGSVDVAYSNYYDNVLQLQANVSSLSISSNAGVVWVNGEITADAEIY